MYKRRRGRISSMDSIFATGKSGVNNGSASEQDAQRSLWNRVLGGYDGGSGISAACLAASKPNGGDVMAKITRRALGGGGCRYGVA